MSAATLEWESQRRRSFGRTVAISTLGHVVVVAILLAGPAWRPRRAIGPSVVTVELIAAAPALPRKVAPPPPAPPSPRKIVLPARPTRTVPTPPPAIAKAEPPPKPVEQEYEDLLDKLRADAGERRPDPVDRRQPTPEPVARPTRQAAVVPQAAAPSGGAGTLAPPEVVAWVRDARIHVRRVWVLAAGFRLQDLETHVTVDLDSQGRLQGEPRVTRRSGNPWYDESVVRAIQKADPLPAPPEAGEWPFIFRPEDR